MSATSIRKLEKVLRDSIIEQAKRDAERDKREAERDAQRVAERIKRNAEMDKLFANMDRRLAESKKKEEEGFRQLRQELGKLGISYGEQIEAIFANLGDKFNVLGYDFPKEAKGGVKFLGENRRVLVEVDQFLENGEVVMPVEIKAKLKIDDVNDHIERLGKIKEYNIIHNDKRKVLGAVGGGIVPNNVRDYAIKKGLFVLVQNGESIEIANAPTSFRPKEW